MHVEYFVAFTCAYLEGIGTGMSGLNGERLKRLFILPPHIHAGNQDGKGSKSSIEGRSQSHRDKRPKLALLGTDFIAAQGAASKCAIVFQLRLTRDGGGRVSQM